MFMKAVEPSRAFIPDKRSIKHDHHPLGKSTPTRPNICTGGAKGRHRLLKLCHELFREFWDFVASARRFEFLYRLSADKKHWISHPLDGKRRNDPSNLGGNLNYSIKCKVEVTKYATEIHKYKTREKL